MLNLDQIRQLEERVSKAIELMQSLKDENDLLKLELHDRQKRIEELENIVLVFKNDQAKIEEGIINALNHLSAFEDTVYQAAASHAGVAQEQAPAQEAAASDVAAPTEESAAASETENASQPTTVVSVTVTQPASGEPANSNQMEIF